MPKLTLRQIIILGAAVIAALYGGYDFFFAKSKKAVAVDTGKKIEELNQFMAEITVALGKDTPLPVDAHIIKRAEAGWARNPFYDRKTETAWAAVRGTAAAPKSPFSYTGYVEAGMKKIAVINGHEYVAGNALDVEGYVLKAIYPARVRIYNRESRRTTDIPLQE
ncbi:MAG: hypothetical protein V1766_11115 [Pseudomonadota bacterium]